MPTSSSDVPGDVGTGWPAARSGGRCTNGAGGPPDAAGPSLTAYKIQEGIRRVDVRRCALRRSQGSFYL
jgi:hypothetical protein